MKEKNKFCEKFGRFSNDGSSYYIETRKTPRNWLNYLFNDTCVSFVSQVAAGESIAQDDLGRRVTISTGRMIYIVDSDSGEWWTANGLPVSVECKSFCCEHSSLGFTKILLTRNDIRSEFRIFNPNFGKIEFWSVTLSNDSCKKRSLRLIPLCSTDIDGPYTPQTYNTGTAEFVPKLNGVRGKSAWKFESADNRELYGFLTASVLPDGFDTRRNSFIGVYSTPQNPEAMERGCCSDTDCLGEKICFALQNTLSLEPGESKTFHYAAYLSYNPNEKIDFTRIENEFENVIKKRSLEISGLSIETPNFRFDSLFNNWLKRQTVLGARWARVRHNGFRDIVSDCDCLSSFNPELAAEDFKRILKYQYSNGYAPRTFRDGAICDNNFADCAVGIASTACNIFHETGDRKFLETEVPFNDASSATVYEHCRRAVNFFRDFKGPHGLLKIWGGDWNDCMNSAGLQGRGESVWLSLAWIHAALKFAEMAEETGHHDDVPEIVAAANEMRDIVNSTAWDGSYYMCAYKDDGSKIGSSVCDEGKIFLIPQLWSILSGTVDAIRMKDVLDTIDNRLADPFGTLVSTPGYTHVDNSIGIIGCKPAGVHENGGIYLHTMAWKIAVEGILKRRGKLYETLQKTIPVADNGTERMCEPYIMCNSIFGKETGYRYGSPGQSWRSASGQWLFNAVARYLFGLKPTLAGLIIDPCIPLEWPRCHVVKIFRETEYNIYYKTSGDTSLAIFVNGEAHDPTKPLPIASGKRFEVTVRS